MLIFGWRLMVVVMIYVDGGCQELPNELKNTKKWTWEVEVMAKLVE